MSDRCSARNCSGSMRSARRETSTYSQSWAAVSGSPGTRALATGPAVRGVRKGHDPIGPEAQDRRPAAVQLAQGTTASISPRDARFSAVWMPSGNTWPVMAVKARGPRKPTIAPGSAVVMSPADPSVARTPPVVGPHRCTR